LLRVPKPLEKPKLKEKEKTNSLPAIPLDSKQPAKYSPLSRRAAQNGIVRVVAWKAAEDEVEG